MKPVLPAPAHKRIPAVIKEIVLDEETIQRRVQELGQQISRDHQGEELLVVAVLKGAFVFACDLIRHLSLPVELDLVAISPYKPSSSGGEVRIIKDLEEDITGRHILLVEDIVDTGLTLNYLVRLLQNRCPATLEVCSLLDRPDLRLVDIPIRYVGFHVSHEFLIGYGLDYRNLYRDLPFLATMKVT